MGEEVLVLGGEDRIPNNGRDVLIPGDLAAFRSHLNERLTVDVVDVADGGELKPAECLQVRQVGSIKPDVTDSPCSQSGRNDCGATGHGHNNRRRQVTGRR